LTGILGGLVAIIFLITLNSSDSKPSEVAEITPDTNITSTITTTEETESRPSKQETISSPTEEEKEIIPVIEQEIILEEEKETSPAIEQKTTSQQEIDSLQTEEEAETEIPPVIALENTSATSEEQNISEDEIEPPAIIESQETTSSPPEEEIKLEENAPITPPIRQLTPEETLIAAIQKQVGEISLNQKNSNSNNQNFSEIIESIQANFYDSNLTIKINKDWYKLEKLQQDKLAAKILQWSQELDFTHLEITDLQGKLIARSPVIGNEMIIFKRK